MVHGRDHKKSIDEFFLFFVFCFLKGNHKEAKCLCLGAIQKWQLLPQHLWLVLSADVGGAELLNASLQHAGTRVLPRVPHNIQKQRLIAMETMVKLHIEIDKYII